MSFTSLGLVDSILRAINNQCYKRPTPIQHRAIPAILEGRDLLAVAQTGTGKTASFILPLLQRLSEGEKTEANSIRALVLTPTRELAAQVGKNTEIYGKYLALRSNVVFGGVKINPQMQMLRGGLDILVATPGRLLDLYNKNAVRFTQLEFFVLDEADRMLDLGFIDDIQKIMGLLPKQRQNLLFSATFSPEIRRLAGKILYNPIEIEISPQNRPAKSIKQIVVEVDKSRKTDLLHFLITSQSWQQVLVFTCTKRGANQLTQKLEAKGVKATAIHGDKSQAARTAALAQFKIGKVTVLVATDLAARGIDIDQLPHVVNFELPKVAENYIHRIGRTGRAGSRGEAISLVSADEVRLLQNIETLIQQRLTRETEIGYEPKHPVPLTEPRKGGPKKPKKPKSRDQGLNRESKHQAAQKKRPLGNSKGQQKAANKHRK